MGEKNKKLSAANEIMLNEMGDLQAALDATKGGVGELLEKEQKVTAVKVELEKSYADLNKRLEDEQAQKNLIQQQKKKVEQEMDGVRKDLDDLEQMISKANLDKDTKDAQIRNLMEEIAHQDELITK